MKESTYILILVVIGVVMQEIHGNMSSEMNAAGVILCGLFFVCRAIEGRYK